jgi:hypothetical protein
VVSIQVRKTNQTQTASGTAEVRLTSGDVDAKAPVHWTAAVPQDAPWLSCDLLTGTVDGQSPASQFRVNVNVSGLNGTLSSSLTITSTSSSMATDGAVALVHGSKLSLPVNVTVLAVTYLTDADVTISSKDDGEPVVFSGARVPAGTSLSVTARTRDSDRLIIDRSDQQLELVVTSVLGGYNTSIKLLHATGRHLPGEYEAEIPGALLATTGTYMLRLVVLDEGWSGVSVTFKVVDSSRKTIIFAAVAAAVLGTLLIVMLVVAGRNRERMKEVAKSFLKLEIRTAAEMIIDAWDIYGRNPPDCAHSFPPPRPPRSRHSRPS